MGAVNAATGLHGVGSGTALAVGAGISSRLSPAPAAHREERPLPDTRGRAAGNAPPPRLELASERIGRARAGLRTWACARAWESGGPGAWRALPGLRSFGGGGTGWGCTCRLSLSRLPPLSPPGSPESPGSSGSPRQREEGKGEERDGKREGEFG